MQARENSKAGIRYWVVAAIFVAAILGGAWWLERPAPQVNPTPAPAGMASMPMPPAELQQIEVLIPTDSLERMRLGFAKVTEGSASVEARVPGTAQPNAYREVRVSQLAGGVITQVSAELGQTVKRGQALAQLFSQERADAQTTLVTFVAELEAEHKKLLRTVELVELGAASRQELETVEAGHQIHTAHVEQARQKLLLLGLDESQIAQVAAGRPIDSNFAIPAPIDGVIVARSVNPGQVVAMGQDLFTVTDLSSVWIEGNLLENDFAAVRVGSRASITTPAYPERTYRGVVDYIDPRVDPETRTAKVRVVVENVGLALRLGMYMDMLFTSPGGARGPIVPKEAIQTIGVRSVVYVPVASEEGRFLQRTLRLGAQAANGVLVLEGLTPGETVVTEGSFLLRAEALRQNVQ